MLKAEKESKPPSEDWCTEFLKKHNNITHYVASITLGAMQYTVLETSTRSDGSNFSAEVEVPKVGKVGAEIGATGQSSALQSKTETVGKFTEDMTTVTSPEVVGYECKSLIALVSDPVLKEALQSAITQIQAKQGNFICVFIHNFESSH